MVCRAATEYFWQSPSIPQDQGKTLLLPVLPLVAALRMYHTCAPIEVAAHKGMTK